MESLNLLGSSVFPHLLNDPLLQQHQQQQNQGDPQQQEYQYDDIDIGDMGYDMMDYDLYGTSTWFEYALVINMYIHIVMNNSRSTISVLLSMNLQQEIQRHRMTAYLISLS